MQEKPPFDCTLFCGPQYDGHFCANDCKHERWLKRQTKSKQHDLELFVRRWTGHGVEINLDRMN